VSLSKSEGIRGAALDIFKKALPALLDFDAPRSWAFALVGIHAYLRKFSGDSEVRRIRVKLSHRLLGLYRENYDPDWPWIENSVNYANGKISQALIVSGRGLEEKEMLEAGLRSLGWLIKIQTDVKGHFVPIGNNGWYPRGGEKARFDQQAIEALNMIEACREAYYLNNDVNWINSAQRCLEWFLGRNDLNVPLYDHKTGGCSDGLGSNGPNRNQGAESTLVCFLSILNLHLLRSAHVSAEAAVKTEEKKQGKGAAHVS
jgi:hypothetical protein